MAIDSHPTAAITEIVNSIRPGNRKTEATQSRDERGEWIAADSIAVLAAHFAEAHTKADANNCARTVAKNPIEGDVDMVAWATARGPDPAGGR